MIVVANLLRLRMKLIKSLAAIAITSALLSGCNSHNTNDINDANKDTIHKNTIETNNSNATYSY